MSECMIKTHDDVFVGEIAASVSTRRFYMGYVAAGSLESEKIMLKYVFCVDDLPGEKGSEYRMVQDPFMFSESPCKIDLSKFISTKILDPVEDKEILSQYVNRVQAIRIGKHGLVKASSLHGIK